MKQKIMISTLALCAALCFVSCENPLVIAILPDTYTITFNKNGGDTEAKPNTKIVLPSTTTVDKLPAEPTRAGYTFTGWNKKADSTGAAFTAATPITDNITVYAQWTANIYTVTFNKNNGDTEANPSSKTVTFPATTINALPNGPTRVGYIFAGWNTKADGSGTVFTVSTPVTASIMVYAQWESIPPGSFVVTFDKNGGDTAANPSSKIVTVPVTTIGVLPNEPTRIGYAFAGWNTRADGSGTPFTAITPVTVSIIVYAQWTANIYTITFNKNNGDTEANPLSKTVTVPATTIDTLPNEPTRTGYAFAGWNTRADGIGTPFTATTPVTGSITVYAQWMANTYTVTFNKNNGDTEANPSSKTMTVPVTTIGVLPNEPTRIGYAFAGWNTRADGSGTVFTATTPVTGSITVYAQWTANTYTITFNKNNGDTEANPLSKIVTVPATTIETLPNEPTRIGYAFAGWNTKADGSGTAFTAATPVTGSITVYAQWTANIYTVTFNKNNGDTEANPSSKIVTVPATTIDALPNEPTRTGYAFAGWNTEADGSGTAFIADTPVTGSITVYAQWIAGRIFTLNFEQIADIELSITGPTIYRSSAHGITTATLTVQNHEQYSSIDWFVYSIHGTGETFELDSSNIVYNMIGTHFLTIEVVKNGVTYNNTITVKVEL